VKNGALQAGYAERTRNGARSRILDPESASGSKVGNKLWGKPLRWSVSAGEDMLGSRRLEPGGSSGENPTAQGKPRAEGENISHMCSSHLNGDSEAH